MAYSYQGQEQVCLDVPCGFGDTVGQVVSSGLTGSFAIDLDVLAGGSTRDTTIAFNRMSGSSDDGGVLTQFEQWFFSVTGPKVTWSAASERFSSNAPEFEAVSESLGFGVGIFGGFQEFVTHANRVDFSISFDENGDVASWDGGCACGGSFDPATSGDVLAGTGRDGRFGQNVGSTGPGTWLTLSSGPIPFATPVPVPLTATAPFLLAALGGLGAMRLRKRVS